MTGTRWMLGEWILRWSTSSFVSPTDKHGRKPPGAERGIETAQILGLCWRPTQMSPGNPSTIPTVLEKSFQWMVHNWAPSPTVQPKRSRSVEQQALCWRPDTHAVPISGLSLGQLYPSPAAWAPVSGWHTRGGLHPCHQTHLEPSATSPGCKPGRGEQEQLGDLVQICVSAPTPVLHMATPGDLVIWTWRDFQKQAGQAASNKPQVCPISEATLTLG